MIIERIQATNLQELIEKLQKTVPPGSRADEILIEDRSEWNLALEEATLTDGSKVYNLLCERAKLG
jgi:hypothetical protein